MSRRLTGAEFAFHKRLWMDAHPGMSVRDRAIWQSDWQAAMETLKYVHGLRCSKHDELDCMMTLRGSAAVSIGNIEAVMADIETIWSDDLAAGLKAIHTFRLVGDCLEMRFVCLDPSEAYITGFLALVVKP